MTKDISDIPALPPAKIQQYYTSIPYIEDVMLARGYSIWCWQLVVCKRMANSLGHEIKLFVEGPNPQPGHPVSQALLHSRSQMCQKEELLVPGF